MQVVVAGEELIGGDMIAAIDDKDVASVDALREAIAAHKPERASASRSSTRTASARRSP